MWKAHTSRSRDYSYMVERVVNSTPTYTMRLACRRFYTTTTATSPTTLYSYSCYFSSYSYYYFYLYSTSLHHRARTRLPVSHAHGWVAKGLRKLMMQPTSSSTYNKDSGGGGGARVEREGEGGERKLGQG